MNQVSDENALLFLVASDKRQVAILDIVFLIARLTIFAPSFNGNELDGASMFWVEYASPSGDLIDRSNLKNELAKISTIKQHL